MMRTAKCLEAREQGGPKIVCWGDGTPTREFLYVEDAAEAIVLAVERYDEPEPVNIGAGFEIRRQTFGTDSAGLSAGIRRSA